MMSARCQSLRAGPVPAGRHTQASCRRLAALPHRRRHYLVSQAAAGSNAEEQQPHQQQVDGGNGNSSATSSSDGVSAATLQADVHSLLEALARQQEQQAQALQLVMEQQRTIASLESRLMDRGEEKAGRHAAAAAAAAHAQQVSSQQQHPLDGPEAVLEPTALERPVRANYSGRSQGAAGWRDLSLLPKRIVLVRHAQSKGNVDPFQYTFVPDPSVPLTSKGWEQAIEAGERLRGLLESEGEPPRVFAYTSPYLRCKQTTEGLVQAFAPDQLLGVQEEILLREQDFGNFQDAEGKKREKLERLRYGRFFYRFPHGESGADVYQRMTIFQDHLIRDMEAGRFGDGATLLLVTHGLASRIFLQRWFHWTVEQFLAVWNPGNAEPIVMELTPRAELLGGAVERMHTKALYRLSAESQATLQGCTDDMCETGWVPRGIHWGTEEEAAPEEGPALQQSSVAYQ